MWFAITGPRGRLKNQAGRRPKTTDLVHENNALVPQNRIPHAAAPRLCIRCVAAPLREQI